jgi:hypothetical protein
MRKIRSIIEYEDWKKFKLAHLEQGFWLSHAGLDERYFGIDHTQFDEATVQKRCRQAIESIDANAIDPFVMQDMSRGGMVPVGSILWMDWEWFTPVYGVDQIVGHSPNHFVRYDYIPGSQNTCIDTNNQHNAIIEDGVASYHDAPK